MPAEYSFVSRWSVPADADRTWHEVVRMVTAPAGGPAPHHPGPSWWPGVRFEDAPASLEVGATLRLVVRSPLGYRLRVRVTIDEVGPGRTVAASSAGDLRGRGRVQVEPDGDTASVVIFHWDVVTERRWMNAGAWALRPAFERAHAHVMRTGERGLQDALAKRVG